MFGFKRRAVVSASQSARKALGLPFGAAIDGVEVLALAAVEEAIAPPPEPEPPLVATRPPIPTEPAGHLRYAERVVAEMEEEAAKLARLIELEATQHAEALATEEARHKLAVEQMRKALSDIRRTQQFYATAPGILGEAKAQEPAPRSELETALAARTEAEAKVSNLRGHTSAESRVKRGLGKIPRRSAANG